MQLTIGSYDLNSIKSLGQSQILKKVLDREIDIICFQKIKKAIQKELSEKCPNKWLFHGKDISILVNQAMQIEQSRVETISAAHFPLLEKGKLIAKGLYDKKGLEEIDIKKEEMSFQIWNTDFTRKNDSLGRNQIEEFVFNYMLNHRNLAFITHGILKEQSMKQIETYLRELQFMPIYFEQVGLSPIYIPIGYHVSIEDKEDVKLYKITKKTSL